MHSGKAGIMFDCHAGTTSGAELTTLHLTLGLHEHASIQVLPKVGASPWIRFCTEQEVTRLRASMLDGVAQLDALMRTPDATPLPATLVRMLGGDLLALPNPMDRPFARSIGFTGVTNTACDAATLERGRSHDVLLAGSSWQTDLLRSAGLDNVVHFAPGFDGRRFRPGAKRNLFPGRFVIFSGGRLDFRKGQDLVIAAVREFCKRHPETLLVHAWQHPWPECIVPFAAGALVDGLPRYVGGQMLTAPWLAMNGLPTHSAVDIGMVANGLLPDIVREAHVGLFPSRAEAQPSAAMLECMASGVPCIMTRNTGHLDLAREPIGYPLVEQSDVAPAHARVRGTDGWGTARVDDILAQLEQAYTNTNDARRKGVAAAREVATYGWHRHTAHFTELLQPILDTTRVQAAA